jgi:hypothetical protein
MFTEEGDGRKPPRTVAASFAICYNDFPLCCIALFLGNKAGEKESQHRQSERTDAGGESHEEALGA